MPPKSRPPRRSPKTTVRKNALSKCTSNLKPSLSASSDDSVYTLPPRAANATSSPGLPLNDAGLLTPEGKINPKLEKSSTLQSSGTNSDAEPQGESLVMPSVSKIAVGGEVHESDLVNLVSSEAGISSCRKADDGGRVAVGAGAEIEGKTGRAVDGGGGDEALADVDNAAIGAGDGELKNHGENRTRKVVKKKVRVVKRIVKRKVPKRVVKGSVGNEEAGRVENVGHSDEENENMECEKVDPFGTASVVAENSKSNETLASEIENEDLKEVKVEAMENIRTCSSAEKENVGSLMENELERVEVEKVDPSGTFFMETENCKPNVAVALEVENEVKVDRMESIKTGPSAVSTVKGEDEEELGDSSGKRLLEGLVAGQNDGKENARIEDQSENQDTQVVEMKIQDLVDDQNTGAVKERQGEGEDMVKELVGSNGVGLNGGVALTGDMEVMEGESEDVVKEVVENNDIGFNGGVALSGEMEALERKKRRRTQIFLGGLDKDTKEEDIRKVFEQVGEVTEVSLVMNGNTGKNKGFAFLRFGSASDAKKALEKYSTVKICGKQCGVQPVEGNDTIYLGNINKIWKTEDVVKLLKDAGIEKIDKVTVLANPSNFEQNRGFAFLEFETTKDAQIALSKLQKNGVFVNQMKIKVAWAQPLIEPKEEDMLKVKSVYAEYLPPSWDEERVIDFFRRFGEIESVSLAKNLTASKRKDFAFVNYAMREAALACIEAFSHGQVDDEGYKLKVKVSLAKPNSKAKQKKHISGTTGKKLENEKRKASESIIKVHEPRKKGKPASSTLEGTRVDRAASATDELLQLLRQQAVVGQTQPASAGSSNLNYHYAPPGSKGPLSALGAHPLSSDPREFARTYLETPHLSRTPSAVSHPVGMVSLPYFQQPRTSYTPESFFRDDPYVKTRQQANYFGHGGIYRRY